MRHLAYSNDGRTLLLSTVASGAIQHYSTERSRLLDPHQSHPSSPTALALSPTGTLLVSASDQPPTIHLKDLAQNLPPTIVQSSISQSAATCAAFHPENANLFLVAFRDATLVAYDASRILKRGSQALSHGEVGHIKALHRATLQGDSSGVLAPIVDATFFPGFKTRAVTAGRDGICKIVDLAGGVVLRTWHVPAFLSSISVLTVNRNERSRSESRRKGEPIGSPSLIATGCEDGQVRLYDGIGTLVAQQTVCSLDEKILHVEWMKGTRPTFPATNSSERRLSNTALPDIGTTSQGGTSGAIEEGHTAKTKVVHTSSNPKQDSGLGLPDSLRRTNTQNSCHWRNFTIHPDEYETGTVLVKSPTTQGKSVMPSTAYNDLFSPIKPIEGVGTAAPRIGFASPLRNRPRISSQTFANENEPQPSSAGHNGTGIGESACAPVPKSTITQTSGMNTMDQRPATQVETGPHRVRDNFHTGTSRQSDTSPKARSNARILADIRTLAESDGPSQVKRGTLSSYAVAQRLPSARHLSTRTSPKKGSAALAGTVALATDRARQKDIHVARPDTWPTDSTSVASLDDAGEDIWLTSESDVSTFLKRKRHLRNRAQRTQPGDPTPHIETRDPVTVTDNLGQRPQPQPVERALDGFTEQQGHFAQAHLAADTTFSPASEDIRGLFPRSSSLSPQRKQRSSKKPRLWPRPAKPEVLTETSANAAVGQQRQNPWARAKTRHQATAKAPAVQVLEVPDHPLPVENSTNAPPGTCLACSDTRARMLSLEGEVAHLKGEVLALKAVLRQNGLPLPPSLR